MYHQYRVFFVYFDVVDLFHELNRTHTVLISFSLHLKVSRIKHEGFLAYAAWANIMKTKLAVDLWREEDKLLREGFIAKTARCFRVFIDRLQIKLFPLDSIHKLSKFILEVIEVNDIWVSGWLGITILSMNNIHGAIVNWDFKELLSEKLVYNKSWLV